MTAKLPGEIIARIKSTARRLDRVYGGNGNDIADIENELLRVALTAQTEWRCA